MKRTIEIDDTIQDRIDSAIDDVKTELLNYLEENPDTSSLPCISNDLDYSGAIHEIIDGSVPIYTKEIEDTWYLHASKLEEAYEDSGIGDNPRENNGMVAIYCYIEQAVHEWYRNEGEEVFDQWKEKQKEKALEGMEFFYMDATDFLNAEEGSWMADLLTEKDTDDAERGEEAAKLEGWYYWSCQPGCLPDGETNGPFETEEEAKEDCIANA